MQLILLERVQHLGALGEVVTVKPGYGRNFLLPQGKAVLATKNNIADIEARRAKMEEENAAKRADAEKAAKKVDGLEVILVRQAGESGQLFGSVSSRDVAEAVSAKGHAVTKNQVEIAAPVKFLGLYDVTIKLHPEVFAKVVINVAKSETEAVLQKEQAKIDAENAKKLAEKEAQEAAIAKAAKAAEADAPKAEENAAEEEKTEEAVA